MSKRSGNVEMATAGARQSSSCRGCGRCFAFSRSLVYRTAHTRLSWQNTKTGYYRGTGQTLRAQFWGDKKSNTNTTTTCSSWARERETSTPSPTFLPDFVYGRGRLLFGRHRNRTATRTSQTPTAFPALPATGTESPIAFPHDYYHCDHFVKNNDNRRYYARIDRSYYGCY